jgi:xanthine dehydrogenase accessory factor
VPNPFIPSQKNTLCLEIIVIIKQEMKSIYIYLLKELKKKNPLALVTIIRTKGSTPQIPGATALFSSEGLLKGTVGGGILEADAQKRALQSLQKKISLYYTFDLNADISSEEGSICGGEVMILIDALPEEHIKTLQNMSRSLNQRHPGVLATFISKNCEGKISITRHWIEKSKNFEVDSEGLPGLSHVAIVKTLMENKSNLLKIKEKILIEKCEETLIFLEPIYPLPHLIIIGAGHIGHAVSHLGNLLDFEVTVIDDRPEFANKEKLPDADHIIIDDIEKAVQSIPISSETFVVIVTRGHRNDADALRQCIDSDAAYIGMIGSLRKIKLMRRKFIQTKWATPDQFDRICAPIGIDIQSKTVQEIAVSIAAQLIHVRSQKQIHMKDVVWSGP